MRHISLSLQQFALLVLSSGRLLLQATDQPVNDKLFSGDSLPKRDSKTSAEETGV